MRTSTTKRVAQAAGQNDVFSRPAVAGHNSFWTKFFPKKSERMYAIAFDFDQEQLGIHDPDATITNAYEVIRRELEKHGFQRQQGSVYFGSPTVTPVTCVVAVQALQARHPWFARVVSDLRMLRIEEHNDLMPAIGELRLDL